MHLDTHTLWTFNWLFGVQKDTGGNLDIEKDMNRKLRDQWERERSDSVAREFV